VIIGKILLTLGTPQKSHSARSCRTWAKGGPIKEDNKSAEWQSKAKLKESVWSGPGPLAEPIEEQ
jgi:hypothetical protein